MIKVNGAWYVDALPTMVVAEMESGELKMFYLNPFRAITAIDLKEYKGYHPRKCKGQPLPNYLYKFYEIEKSDETASETIHIRLTPSEKSKAESAAQEAGKNVSELVRDYIKSL